MAGYKTARREGGGGSETRRYGIINTYLPYGQVNNLFFNRHRLNLDKGAQRQTLNGKCCPGRLVSSVELRVNLIHCLEVRHV